MNKLTPGDTMPLTVKIFFWVCVVLVAWWIFLVVKFITFPSAEYLALIAKLRPYAPDLRQRDISLTVGRTLLWSSLILSLAWLTAYRRKNWARWTFASLLVVTELFPFAVVLYGYIRVPRGEAFLRNFLQHNWSSPWAYGQLACEIALIVLIFSPNARPWFRREAPAA